MIIAGVLVLASIFLFGNPEKKRKPRASRKKDKRKSGRQEPTLEKALDTEESAAEDRTEPGQGELAIEAVEPEPRPAKEPPRPVKPAGPPPDKITSLFLLARDNHIINGAELLQAALKTGMEFGEMNIFHRIPEGAETAIFSMANAAKPGHFDRGSWNTFETSGVVLFMTLPGPAYALDTWDSMLATARRIAEILHAELLDDEHSPFTRQKEAQIREEMREYDRSKS
jgi:cell division protein ZipA